MLVESAHVQKVLLVLVVTETEAARPLPVGVGDPVPPYPVREQSHAGIAHGDVFADGGKERVHEIEMRPRIRPHRIIGHAARKPAVVPGDGIAVGEQLQAKLIAALQMRSRQFIAETVARGREPRIPQKTRNAVKPRLYSAGVAADDARTPFTRLNLLDVLHERNDNLPPLDVGKRLVHPIVCAQRQNAPRRKPMDRAAVAVGFTVGGDARLEHPFDFFKIFVPAGKAPGERTDRRRASELHRLGNRLRRRREDRPRIAADGIQGLPVGLGQQPL